MPIEIRELVIKAVVGNDTTEAASSSSTNEDALQLSLEQISEMKRLEKER